MPKLIVGIYLLGWTIFTAYMTMGALRVSGAVTAVFALLTLTFLFLTIGAFGSTVPLTSSWTKIGGWLGLATAAAAWYASATVLYPLLPTTMSAAFMISG